MSDSGAQSYDVAALYVEKDGAYYGLPGVDPWDESRDARLYAGPFPVVAHPPCASWSIMGQCRPERTRGEDGGDDGCFAAALEAVRRFGGVIEHPRHSRAWRYFDLPRPTTFGWSRSFTDEGWATEVDQGRYGHDVFKPTWLYFVGESPPSMRWGESQSPRGRNGVSHYHGGHSASSRGQKRSRTPAAFRDVLLAMARSARVEAVA